MSTQPEKWAEEFDIIERNHGWIPEHKERIKNFIRQTREEARNEVIEEAIEDVRKLQKKIIEKEDGQIPLSKTGNVVYYYLDNIKTLLQSKKSK